MIRRHRRRGIVSAALLLASSGACSGRTAEPWVVAPSARDAQQVALACEPGMPTEADLSPAGRVSPVRSVETRAERETLYRVLEASLRDSAVVALRLRLSDARLADLPLRADMLYLSLDFDPLATQGAELLVDLSGGCERLRLDRRPGHGALAGHFRVREITGPRMGIMSVVVVPVPPHDAGREVPSGSHR